MTPIEDHPLRYTLANELHARPFPSLEAPCGAIYLAIKRPEDAAERDRDVDRAHLTQLLDRYGAPHPQPGATHWFGEVGKFKLKWEQHTEFVTYTMFMPTLEDRPFDPKAFETFPADWLASAPGVRITSALIRVEADPGADEIVTRVEDWFVPESLAVSTVLDGAATVAGDFRIDAAGHMRLAVFVADVTGERRIGRIVQRLCEIETYKSMSMLGLARVRDMGLRLGELDAILSGLMSAMTKGDTGAEDTLSELLATSAELESLLAQSSFRFGATGAYEAIVNQRIEVLREERFNGRQTFAEFMMRRFDPAMRTVKASERRLQNMAERATRAGDLLRTRVDVERSSQNQKLLESMDKRADLQLRLQKTVEGLSVVAISYYAVNLVLYMAQPAAYAVGLSKLVLAAVTTPLVVLAVWWMVHRIREKME
ncbi:putative membrane-anchored protein [Litoreibacter halocynthiae]|uniref:Putative membrane-anchored protein n=1 Tax=Litoreibacter halocynthiae TaxID=1242689 RepID=A0A4R7LK08_9RHOB|nr:DUF3422 domain-containing protein [Litoreibacter halocynthiae]TDT74986.1 putative membrane-anchored protein [Litoreibacter halocynthiae]